MLHGASKKYFCAAGGKWDVSPWASLEDPGILASIMKYHVTKTLLKQIYYLLIASLTFQFSGLCKVPLQVTDWNQFNHRNEIRLSNERLLWFLTSVFYFLGEISACLLLLEQQKLFLKAAGKGGLCSGRQVKLSWSQDVMQSSPLWIDLFGSINRFSCSEEFDCCGWENSGIQ